MGVCELRIINISPPVDGSESKFELHCKIMGSLFHRGYSANYVAMRFYE